MMRKIWYNRLKNILKTTPQANIENKKFVRWDKNRLLCGKLLEY